MPGSNKNSGKLPLPALIRQKGLPDTLTDSDLAFLWGGTENRRYSLTKRTLARGDLIPVRRGLYVLGDLYRQRPVNLFELAQRIYGPSYISFESALSYW